MSNYIKVNNQYKEIQSIYKKISGIWTIVNDIQNVFDNTLYFYDPISIDISATLQIIGESQYTGKSFILSAKYGDRTIYPTWSITAGSQYASINSNGKVTINSGVQNQNVTVSASWINSMNETYTETKTIIISYDNELAIDGAATMTGISGNVIARYNGNVVTPTWTITSGNQYATIDNAGTINIVSSGTIIVSATYSGYTTTKTIELIYEANTSTETIVDPDTGTTTTTTTTTTQNQDGSTSTSSTTTTTNEDGSSSETVTNTTENQDGSSTSTSTTTSSDGSTSQNETVVNTDGSSTSQTTTQNADGTSQQSQTDTASDGSSTNTTTNYDENGDPISGSNNTTDVEGNSNTQELIYDENGDPTVTAYTIDTTGNENGTGEEITGDGVNTEFVAFNNAGSEGFEMHIVFRTVKTEQPNPPLVEDTEDNGSNYLFNIMTCKSPNKPYRGFHIRWALSKKNYSSGNLVLGYTAANANSTTSRTMYGINNIYDITIIYDPLLKKYPSKFRCISNQEQFSTISANITFESNQLEFVLGYAVNQQGNPYRYSNVTIYEFSITKL